MLNKFINEIKQGMARDRAEMDQMLQDEGLTWGYHRRRAVVIAGVLLFMSAWMIAGLANYLFHDNAVFLGLPLIGAVITLLAMIPIRKWLFAFLEMDLARIEEEGWS
jgi:hypothetical protein